MTCSERLSLEEEYEMQNTWMEDGNKCTFILLDTSLIDPETKMHAMCGDVNLFFNEFDNEGENKREVGEIEIMIAEKESRRKGGSSLKFFIHIIFLFFLILFFIFITKNFPAIIYMQTF